MVVNFESASRQNKILPLSTENKALHKKLKEEEENGKHIPTERSLVGSTRLIKVLKERSQGNLSATVLGLFCFRRTPKCCILSKSWRA